MSGNQYVYVVEEETYNRSRVGLVTKSLKEGIAAYQHRIAKTRTQGFWVADFHNIKRGEMWRYVKPGSRNVCVRWCRLERDGVGMVTIKITAWVIKWAKEEVPQEARLERGYAPEKSYV